jgi:type II secretory pathway component PulC
MTKLLLPVLTLFFASTMHEGTPSAIESPLAQGAAKSSPHEFRLVPLFQDGHMAGLKVFAIKATGRAAKIGLLNGDTITKINDYVLERFDQVEGAHELLSEESDLAIDLLRQGQLKTIRWSAKPK